MANQLGRQKKVYRTDNFNYSFDDQADLKVLANKFNFEFVKVPLQPKLREL